MTSTDTRSPALDTAALTDLIEKADLPAGVKAKLLTNPYLLGQLLTALGQIDFKRIEGNRAYSFLLVVDRSSSVGTFSGPLVQCIAGTYENLKKIKTTGTIIGGAVAITDMVAGGEVMIPLKPINQINIGTDFEFEPSGVTPLYDTLVVALVAQRILVKMAAAHGKQLVPLTYVVTDGYELGSSTFNAQDARDMVAAITTGRRKGRVAGVAVDTDPSMFEELGIPREATRQIGTTQEELAGLFDEMSQSVDATSQGGDAGGF